MLSKIKALARRPRVSLWSRPVETDRGEPLAVLEQVTGRWRSYQGTEIDRRVTEHDDMLEAEGWDAYREVGLSALRIMSEAMVLSGRTRFETILDLPCGGGRVTRHLKAFFPESALFVADIDEAKQSAVAGQFSADIFRFPHAFEAPPDRRFDLIFSGSLLTHFDQGMFERALDFFIRALAPGGIAALTVHGRTNATAMLRSATYQDFRAGQLAFARHVKETRSKIRASFDPDAALAKFQRREFGYFATPEHSALYKQSYGGSFSPASWVMQRIEERDDCLMLGYKEGSYGGMQDVILLQKV